MPASKEDLPFTPINELAFRNYEFFEVRIGTHDGEVTKRGNEAICREWINRELSRGNILRNDNDVYLFRMQLMEKIKIVRPSE